MIDILPPDFTPEEKEILDASLVTLYSLLPNNDLRFLVCMVYEMGYGKEETARAMGISYTKFWQLDKEVKDLLSREYRVKV